MAQIHEVNLSAQLQEALIDDPDFLRNLLQESLQQFLEREFSRFIGAEPHQRVDTRRGYRCGYYERDLITTVGSITLRVPRDRKGEFSSEIFDRYQRSEKAFVLSLMQMYVQGVSTRKVKRITEELCGVSVSKSLVSTLVENLDQQLLDWKTKPLESHYSVLYVDGMYMSVRLESRVRKMVGLVILGVKPDGKREVLTAAVVPEENETEYGELFDELKMRGLRSADLVVSDAHPGLKSAIARAFPRSAWQRCLVHFLRNLGGKCPARHREEMLGRVKGALQLPNRSAAEKELREIAHWAQGIRESLGNWLEDAIPEILAFTEFPQGLWRRIKSNNLLERFNGELRRRFRVIRIFPNAKSFLRLLTALAAEQDEEWQAANRYLKPSLLNQIQARKAS